jgi:3-hydroxyacyl-[acyl-carrier-protein] dehydratase
MMAQSSCLLVHTEGGKFTPYFTGLKNVKFKNKVIPGDTIEFKTQKLSQKGPFYFMKSEGHVSGKLCVSGEMSFAISK